jgi:hypothetical protein
MFDVAAMIINEDLVCNAVPLNGLHFSHSNIGEGANVEVVLKNF